MAASSISTGAAMEQTPLLGDTTVKPPKQEFILRPAHLADLPIMAVVAKEAYWLSPVNRFVAPRAKEHPEDMVRFQLQGTQKSFATANNLWLLACVPAQDGEDEIVVGCGLFSRKGSDEGAKNFVKNKGWSVRIALWVLGWWFWISKCIANRIWPDRIFDIQALEDFGQGVKMDDEKYWKQYPERHNRWAVASLVVSPAYQGKGIGKLLVCHVIKIAQQEGVPMGLTASPAGEKLYRKLGFQMLGDFSRRVSSAEDGGGIMIWYPQGWEGKRHDEE